MGRGDFDIIIKREHAVFLASVLHNAEIHSLILRVWLLSSIHSLACSFTFDSTGWIGQHFFPF